MKPSFLEHLLGYAVTHSSLHDNSSKIHWSRGHFHWDGTIIITVLKQWKEHEFCEEAEVCVEVEFSIKLSFVWN